MWILRQNKEPQYSGAYKVFGTVNKGSEHETLTVYDANYDTELHRFTDQQGEDLTGIDDGVKYWFDFSQVINPE